MPGLRVAVASGNWSNTATWNGGVLPAAGDIVASNGFTVTIDQNVNVDSLINYAQSIFSAIPTMTSNTTPSGIAESSPNPVNAPYLAFDNNSGTSWRGADYASSEFISYQFATPIAIDKYDFTVSSGGVWNNFTFEGWNGSSWVVLHTVTGNASTTYSSPILGNSTAYIKYRIFYTLKSNYFTLVSSVNMYQYLSTSNSVSGGGFILNSGVTVTCTNTGYGIYGNGVNNLITYSAASGTSTINGNVLVISLGNNVAGVLHSGAGTLNVNGNINGYTASTSSSNPAIRVTGTGILNFTGNVVAGNTNNSGCLQIQSAATVNMIGNIYCAGTNATYAVIITNTATGSIFNLTGNIYAAQGQTPGWTFISLLVQCVCTINITGNIYGENGTSTTSAHLPLSCSTAATITMVGNMYGSNSGTNIGVPCMYLSGASYLNHIGMIVASTSNAGFVSTSTSSINILTGPFIHATNGIVPFYLNRMHLRRTLNAYIEYRDNSTNGALPPAAAAPATSMVSADSIVDAPAISNVRAGVTFALSTLTGTCAIPIASNVSKDTVYDNGTVGTAYIEGTQIASEIWNKLTSDLTVSGSIGERLKNVATVQSTGQQIAAFKI